jgi:predicted PurR-regulated permease PerM
MPGKPTLRDPQGPKVRQADELGSPVTRAAKVTAAVVGVVALAIGLWYARTAVLLAFAGILLAIVLYGASRALADLTKLPRLLMLAVVVLAAALFFILVFSIAGPTLTQQLPSSPAASLPAPRP